MELESAWGLDLWSLASHEYLTFDVPELPYEGSGFLNIHFYDNSSKKLIATGFIVLGQHQLEHE